MREVLRSVAMATILMAGACGQTEPSRFFVLSPLDQSAARTGARASGPAILVGPTDLPKHLDQPQIVTFASANRLDVAEFDRWAEPLTDNFTRVVGENLAILVPSDRVYVEPALTSSSPNYQVTIEVSQFGVSPDRNVQLIALWSVLSGERRNTLVSRRFRHIEPVAGDGYEPTVAAMSAAVAALSRDIADGIRARSRR